MRGVIRTLKDNKLKILGVILIVLAIVMVYFTFTYSKRCYSLECYQQSMGGCSRATYTNVQPEATWKYDIRGSYGDECVVDVKLIEAKQGPLALDKMRGYSMECLSMKGSTNYPESDLGSCNGRLKEELQGVVINKLHAYILENIGKLDQNLTSFK